MITILGGGPAGRIASIRLASAGKEVTLIEGGGIGGQCLHFGCMPVCALNDVARMIGSARELEALGVTSGVPRVHIPCIFEEMHAIQQKIASILDSETKNAGVNILYGRNGRLEGSRVFAGDEEIPSEAVIVATGSRPLIPDIGGLDLESVYTPHTLLSMKTLPEKLSIIGGNVMAAEYAYIFSRFGCEVTIISRSRFLKNLDASLRKQAFHELSDVTMLENREAVSIGGGTRATSVITMNVRKTESIAADAVLIATGLVPRSDMINGVTKGKTGEIIVDEHMRTSVPNVYACGDVIGPPYLTPVARHQGIVAADNILGKPRTMDCRYVPQSISLGHDLAYCVTETDKPGSISIPGPAGPGTFWSVPTGSTGSSKLLFDPAGGEITGACSAGPGAGLIAGYMAFLMQRHFSVHDFEEFIEVHPSTDGMYGLAKFASETLRKNNQS